MRIRALPTLALALLALSFLAGCGEDDAATTAENPTELTPEQIDYERKLAQPQGSR